MGAIAKTPVLGDILSYLGRFGNVGLNLASAAQSAFAGEGDRALSRLGSAAETLPSLIPFTSAPDPENILDPGTVLDEIGITGELGRVDIPLLGAFTGRGVAKFALGVATDPLIYSRLGGFTKAGKAARRIGGKGLKTGIPPALDDLVGRARKAPEGAERAALLAELEKATGGGAFPRINPLQAQAEAGQRALLTFGGATVFRGAPILGSIDRANRFLRATVFRPFVTKSGTVLDTFPQKNAIKLAEELDNTLRETEVLRRDAVRIAEERFRTNPKLYASLDDAQQSVFNELALAAEKKFKRAAGVADQPTILGPEIRKGRIVGKREFRNALTRGHSVREAGIIARAAVNGIPSEIGSLGSVLRRQMKSLLDLELDAGVMVQALSDPGTFYLTHLLTPAARKALGVKGRRKLVREINEFSAGNLSSIKRLHRMEAIPEAGIQFQNESETVCQPR